MATTTFADLEGQRNVLLATLAGWSAGRLAYRPAPDGWSAAQVADHLVRTEAAILAAARRGVEAPRAIGPRDRLGVWFIDRLFLSERRVRVPRSAAAVLPDVDPDVAAVRARWDLVRGELAEFLAPLTAEQRRGGVFRHPVGGWMSVPQVLRFFWVHAHHHGFQLARLAAESAGR